MTDNLTYEPTFNQVTSVTDPLGHTTSFGYDGLGNLITLINPGGIAGAIVVGGTFQTFIPFPGSGVVGGIIGGQLGGAIGSLFDPACAGKLNCGEVVPPPPTPQPCGRKCGEAP